jgi:hypothetical protein
MVTHSNQGLIIAYIHQIVLFQVSELNQINCSFCWEHPSPNVGKQVPLNLPNNQLLLVQSSSQLLNVTSQSIFVRFSSKLCTNLMLLLFVAHTPH